MFYRDQPQVFLSYARIDKSSAQGVYTHLRDKGINVWMDSVSLEPGEEWEETIKSAMQASTLVLVLLSGKSESPRGFFKKEIELALEVRQKKFDQSIFIIPVKLEKCGINPSLKSFHCVDIWTRDGWRKLIKQITRQLHKKKQQANDQLIPVRTYPDAIERFVRDSIGDDGWSHLSEDTRKLLHALGCKLEPIVQIVPTTPTSLILGFECLGLSALGENFAQICSRCRELDPGLLRICLAIAAIKTVAAVRFEAIQQGHNKARNLLFSINLDAFMITSIYFKKFLNWYYADISHNIIFEIKETTTKDYLSTLKNLQVDHDLRYAADSLSSWDGEARSCLIDRVELTKMDHRSFVEAMEIRGEDKEEALRRLRCHKVDHKPLIVEGLQNSDYLHFLERHWGCEFGLLYGQGYILDSELYWKSAVRPLKAYGLPGGSFLSQNAA